MSDLNESEETNSIELLHQNIGEDTLQYYLINLPKFTSTHHHNNKNNNDNKNNNNKCSLQQHP